MKRFRSSRRQFLRSMALSAGAVGLEVPLSGISADLSKPASYRGPNLVLIRFGGGTRRREAIESGTTYSPYLCHELLKRGTLFKRMEIAQIEGLNTSHGEGTLNIVTGHYDKYRDITGKFLAARFEPKVPTLFEYFRKEFQVAPHQTLIINGEDRPDEEFYTFSNHFAYGIDFRSTTLSLYRFKQHLLQRQMAEGKLTDKQMAEKRKELQKWEKNDYRTHGADQQGPELAAFWERWRAYYGENGLVNPRGDSLLTELGLRAIRELRPRMLMINYNDCDYVHWGNMSHYTRAVSIMDQGIRQLVSTIEADPEYRDNTLFVIVPDCGRDSNPLSDVPCQHHFNSRSSHEIFCLLFGPGVPANTQVDKSTDQSQVAATIARLMGFQAGLAEQRLLSEAIA